MEKPAENIRFLGDLTRGPYITLKEAAEMSDYTADYIGQLIRAGKIEGYQVYTNVAWVTTEAAVKTYLESKGKEMRSDPMHARAARISQSVRYTLYGVICILGLLLAILLYIAIVRFDHAVTESYQDDFDPTKYEN